MAFDKIRIPEFGEKVTMGDGGELNVPDQPIVTFIEGDGTVRDILRASQRVLDAAVGKAYGGKRRMAWMEVFAGEKSWNMYGQSDDAWLPQETLDAFREYLIGIKGPQPCSIRKPSLISSWAFSDVMPSSCAVTRNPV